jgi:hypothetical protein
LYSFKNDSSIEGNSFGTKSPPNEALGFKIACEKGAWAGLTPSFPLVYINIHFPLVYLWSRLYPNIGNRVMK